MVGVHARRVLAVAVDGVSGEMRTRRLPGTTSEVVAFCASLPGPTKVAYEAGPTGYGLARALHAAGIGCVSRKKRSQSASTAQKCRIAQRISLQQGDDGGMAARPSATSS